MNINEKIFAEQLMQVMREAQITKFTCNWYKCKNQLCPFYVPLFLCSKTVPNVHIGSANFMYNITHFILHGQEAFWVDIRLKLTLNTKWNRKRKKSLNYLLLMGKLWPIFLSFWVFMFWKQIDRQQVYKSSKLKLKDHHKSS